uniref:Serine/threonine-protein kinase Nek4 n=1 Tax=Iconisemion striatum TaxID=60296 RepID=A0A1A7XPC0_9TELE
MMDSYLFIRVVGKGSYGEVNLVKHKTDRKQYVIKKLNLTTSSKRERHSAEQEAQLLSQLRHPNIVTYRESWEGNDCQLYIVMGFCEGGDLYHRLKQQKGELLPEKQVVEWFVQIAMALQYLHERNILHRDLKTQNIFLTKTNIIKVGDLGIARVLENQNDMASTLIGTPYYMSPELFSNKPYNHKSDVWALGCCVYEMSTLKHAFNARDMNSLVYRIVEGKLPQMPSQYDPQLGDLIRSMLCKRPDDRPDVKLILRQPYIKRQIAMFLEATKEKTAKSRKKAAGGSGDSRANSEASSQLKPQKMRPNFQPESLVRVKKKEDKPPQNKSRSSVTDSPSARAPQQPKSSSSDVLETSIVPMATVSNIDVDIPLQQDDDIIKRQVQNHSSEPISEPVTHSVHKNSKTSRKPDPSPPPSTVNPPLMAVSGVSAEEGAERIASNGLLENQPQTKPNPQDLCFFVEEHVSDFKDDTTELLREADVQIPTLENVTVDVNVKNDTVNLSRRSPTLHSHSSDVQDSLETTDKLLEPLAKELVAPELSSVAAKLDQASPCRSPWYLSEPPVSQQHTKTHAKLTKGDQKQFKVAAQRPLPQPPLQFGVLEGKKRSKKTTGSKKPGEIEAPTSVSSTKDGFLPTPQDRPLTARERRRLRQSQESSSQAGVGIVRRASYDVASINNVEHHNVPVTRSASCSVTESNSKDKLMEQKSDEEECSSSTSSTERSEGDCREKTESCDMHDLVHMMTQTLRMDVGDGGHEMEQKSDEEECSSSTSSTERSEGDCREKTESCDMHDLVHMMTQTLRMDVGDGGHEMDKSRSDSSTLPEFKLNRRYRDTLVLHGKAREEAENLSLSEIPTGSTSGPAKIRRAIEQLRTDVVKGLGVKLLDKVLEIMEEEDELKRELCLRDQMGDEKYQAYAVMVRQLKFFEDVAFKV